MKGKIGSIEIEYIDESAPFGQFNDTTKVIIHRTPRIVANSEVYDCLVSWYKKTDTYYFDRTDNPCDQFEHVVASFDLNRMMQDREYLDYAIRGIPEKK